MYLLQLHSTHALPVRFLLRRAISDTTQHSGQLPAQLCPSHEARLPVTGVASAGSSQETLLCRKAIHAMPAISSSLFNGIVADASQAVRVTLPSSGSATQTVTPLQHASCSVIHRHKLFQCSLSGMTCCAHSRWGVRVLPARRTAQPPAAASQSPRRASSWCC